MERQRVGESQGKRAREEKRKKEEEEEKEKKKKTPCSRANCFFQNINHNIAAGYQPSA